MDRLDKYRAAGRRAGLLMAVTGTVVALIMLTMMGLVHGVGEESTLSAALLAIVAWTIVQGWGLGGRFGVRIAGGASPWLSGLLLALLTVVGTVCTMSLAIAVVLLFAGRGLGVDHLAATLVWLFWVLIFGAVPMLGLGLGYGAMLQKLRR